MTIMPTSIIIIAYSTSPWPRWDDKESMNASNKAKNKS
jgi:hypothetical protein